MEKQEKDIEFIKLDKKECKNLNFLYTKFTEFITISSQISQDFIKLLNSYVNIFNEDCVDNFRESNPGLNFEIKQIQ